MNATIKQLCVVAVFAYRFADLRQSFVYTTGDIVHVVSDRQFLVAAGETQATGRRGLHHRCGGTLLSIIDAWVVAGCMLSDIGALSPLFQTIDAWGCGAVANQLLCRRRPRAVATVNS